MDQKQTDSIGKIRLRDGKELELKRPSLGSFFLVVRESNHFMEQVMLMCTGYTREQLHSLDYIDGVQIIQILEPYFAEINKYQTNIDDMKKNTIN